MSEENKDQEKTEQPSAKRLKDAKEKGQVARSKDFNAMVILLCTGVGLFVFGEQAAKEMLVMMQDAFYFDSRGLTTPHLFFEKILPLVHHGFWAILPIVALIFVVSLGAPMLLGGWIFSTKAFTPQIARLNPLKGLKRMVSVKGFMEMLKSFLKFLLIALVLFFVLRWQIPVLMSLAEHSLESAITGGVVILLKAFILLSSSLILIVIIDVPFQLYQHTQQLKMTKQEVKDEYK
jgi:flagellar biosynthetic protein FlhB